MHKSMQKRALPFVALAALALPFAGSWSGANASSGATIDTRAEIKNALHVAGQVNVGANYTLQQATAQPQQTAQPQPGTQAFASPAFQNVWNRTDKPVASGQVQRSWYWGPKPNTAGLQEDYAEGQGGKRLVQYFDKSRMEINNPSADPTSPFYVTNGLLTVELISGQMQTGNNTFVARYPADIPLASDTDDANAPTYYSFQAVSNTSAGDHPANSLVGSPVIATITRAGQVGSDQTKTQYPGINVVYYDQTTHHNVPQAIWDFLNQKGPVYNSATGQTTNAALSDPWYYATGLPISDAYWAHVKIAGQMQDVLIQAFERRVVTYTPNGVPGYKVQMGNIGQHYYDWRYNNAGMPSTLLPTPGTTGVPGTPASTATTKPSATVAPPTATKPPAGPDCSGIPPSTNMTVTPVCGPGGTTFGFRGRGFQPGETVGVYITLPDQSVAGAPFQTTADENGVPEDVGLSTTPDFPQGIYAITMEGTSSHNKAIGYFKVANAQAPTPVGAPTTPPNASSCSDVPASTSMTIQPSNCAKRGTVFRFFGSGFNPGETVGVYLTLPDQAVAGAPFQTTADSNGVPEAVTVSTNSTYPLGISALTMEGVSSHKTAIGYFKVTP